MSRQRIIIDCDPGVDDAVALALCGASSDEIELLGVTVTFGNVGLPETTANALALAALLGLDAPVVAGADRPLVRERMLLPKGYEPKGMGGIDLPAHDRVPDARGAVRFLIETIMADPGNVSVFGIGPQTNLALAMRLEPRLAGSIKQIVLMGGAIGEGNSSPAAESNFLWDPHAARIVIESGAPITLFPLDVTHKVLALDHRLAALDPTKSRVADLMLRLMQAYRPGYKRRHGWDGVAVHDMCTIAWALQPDLFTFKPMTVRIDTNEGPNFGRSVCDGQCRDNDVLPTVQVAYDARADDVFALLAQRLGTY